MKRLASSPRTRGAARALFWIGILIALSGFLGTILHAQISEADKKKRDAFLKAREEMRTVPSSPSESATPAGKPKAATKKKKKKKSSAKSSDEAEPKKSPSAKKRSDDGDDDEASPAAKKRKASPSPRPSETPAAKKIDPDDEPSRRASTPRPNTADSSPPARREPVSTPAPAPTATFNAPPADITIQKSGVEEEQGFEPPPPPPPRRSFWSKVFGGREPTYRYLNRNVINAIRRAPVQRSRWKFIIVHNSGTRQGNARAFDYYHKRVRRMQNGMAYHFVVGNGRSSGDGEIEIGDRWRRQINGGHVHSDYLNNISLGICLVGDFNRDQPTRAQLEATEELIKYLRDRCGRADGRPIGVRPHREMNPPRFATDCPGDAFPYGWFRRF